MKQIFIAVTAGVLFFLPVAAGEPCLCPNRLAKYECSDGIWSLGEGVDDFTIEGDCQEATVTGSFDELWVKSSQSCEVQENPIHTIGGQDISHLSICTNPTAVSLSEFAATSPRIWLQVVIVFLAFLVVFYVIMLLVYDNLIRKEYWE